MKDTHDSPSKEKSIFQDLNISLIKLLKACSYYRWQPKLWALSLELNFSNSTSGVCWMQLHIPDWSSHVDDGMLMSVSADGFLPQKIGLFSPGQTDPSSGAGTQQLPRQKQTMLCFLSPLFSSGKN